MDNKQQSIELCNIGISQKRLGNYTEALKYYDEAKKICETNQDIYYNIAKVLIGLGEYNLAFRNIMIYSHITRITSDTSYFTDNIFMNVPWFEALSKYYWNGQILKGLSIPNIDSYDYALFLGPDYSMVLDFNNSFLAGLCYLLEDYDLIKFHGIEDNFIVDIKNGLLGQNSIAYLKNSKYETLINLTGLLYIITNYIFYRNKLEEIPNLYLSDKFVIERNLKIAKDFLNKEKDNS